MFYDDKYDGHIRTKTYLTLTEIYRCTVVQEPLWKYYDLKVSDYISQSYFIYGGNTTAAPIESAARVLGIGILAFKPFRFTLIPIFAAGKSQFVLWCSHMKMDKI